MRTAFLTAFSILVAVSLAKEESGADRELAELTVLMTEPSAEREAAERGVERILAEFPGTAGRKPQLVVTKAGQGVLLGDLFQTGDSFALVELPPSNADSDDAGVAFARWENGRWKLRQAWKIGTVWRPKGWKESHEDYLPATPTTEPFVLEDFSGEGVPEVVMAGEVGKYFQENYLLRFSPKTKELKLVATAMARPEKVGDFVRLYSNSGRRAIWSEWEFCKWEGEELRSVASWHSETGYNENDPTFSEGMRIGADGRPVAIRVLYGHGQEVESDGYALSWNGRPFGTMHIAWKDPEHLPDDADEMESAWLFEKITGLPRSLFPEGEEEKPASKLEDFATVTIGGNAEGMKFFNADR